MYGGRVSFRLTIPYVDCEYRSVRFEACCSTGMLDVETSKVMFAVRVTVRTVKIPACVGTSPQVTRTTAMEAQNTGQCLYHLVIMSQITDNDENAPISSSLKWDKWNEVEGIVKQ
jgi:hypothetical protein